MLDQRVTDSVIRRMIDKWLKAGALEDGLLHHATCVAGPEEKKAATPDEPRVLPCPCPRCGDRMIVIEVFAPGCEPRYRPTPAPTPIRIDTS